MNAPYIPEPVLRGVVGFEMFYRILAVALVAVLAVIAGSIFFPDRAIKLSAAGFELSPPDVAKCQTEAKLLTDSMVAVTETINSSLKNDF